MPHLKLTFVTLSRTSI